MFKNREITIKEVMIEGHNSLDIFTKIGFVKNLIKNSNGDLTDKELQIVLVSF